MVSKLVNFDELVQSWRQQHISIIRNRDIRSLCIKAHREHLVVGEVPINCQSRLEELAGAVGRTEAEAEEASARSQRTTGDARRRSNCASCEPKHGKHGHSSIEEVQCSTTSSSRVHERTKSTDGADEIQSYGQVE